METADLVTLVAKIQRIKAETPTLELKSAEKGCPKKLYDTLSSFSNQDEGGVIVFGVSEDDYRIVGVYDAEQLEKDVIGQCKQMDPEVRPLFTIAEIDGKVVVSAEIPGVEFASRPVYYKGAGPLKGSFVRVGEADEHMTPYEVYGFEAFRKGIHDDSRIVEDADPSFLNEDLLRTYLAALKKERPNLASIPDKDILPLAGLLKDGHPTIAALMVLSIYPQAFFPQLSVTAVVVPGTEKGLLYDGNARFSDSKKFTGNIKDMLEASIAFVSRNSRHGIAFEEHGSRVDKAEYPEIAVREAILNALQHRDYSVYSEGSPVRIEMYSDRMEIINSGGLYGNMPISRLGEIRPDTRNPLLADILEVMGVSENRYSGIPTMINEFAKAGLPRPEFINSGGEFRVIFRNTRQQSTEFEDVISFCHIPRTRAEIEAFTGMGRSAAYYNVIKPLLDQGLLSMTIPEKPKSKFQRFVDASRR